jgi:hypothetical protein
LDEGLSHESTSIGKKDVPQLQDHSPPRRGARDLQRRATPQTTPRLMVKALELNRTHSIATLGALFAPGRLIG